MKKLGTIALMASLGVALTWSVARSGYSSGTEVSVRSLQATLMAEPEFWGSTVKTLYRGSRVTIVERSGSWYKVSHEGSEGWVHRNRITKERIELSSGDTSGGTTRGEAELAGRGFNPKTEQGFRDKNKALDFTHVDKIKKFDVPPESVGEFVKAGGVKPRKVTMKEGK